MHFNIILNGMSSAKIKQFVEFCAEKKLISCLTDCCFFTDLFIPLLNLNLVLILF
jgi:hypothetical protein